jgi:hypothetical protein
MDEDILYYDDNEGVAGTAALTQQQQQATTFLESVESVNLEEVTTGVVRVFIEDTRLVPLSATDNPLDEDPDRPGYKRVPHPRIAEIRNYVPMRVFNRMLATRAKVMKERKAYQTALAQGDEDDATADPIVEWMLDQVLAVWKLSEPSMTKDRLLDGLEFEKVSALFSRFFGKLLKRAQESTNVHAVASHNHISGTALPHR